MSTWKRSNCSLALPQLHPLHTALVSLVLKTHISGRNKSKVFNKLESAFVYVGVCVCAHQQPKSTKENGPCSAQHMGVAPLLQALNALDALLDRATEIHEPMANDSQCNKIKLCSQVAIMRPYDCPLTQGGAGTCRKPQPCEAFAIVLACMALTISNMFTPGTEATADKQLRQIQPGQTISNHPKAPTNHHQTTSTLRTKNAPLNHSWEA